MELPPERAHAQNECAAVYMRSKRQQAFVRAPRVWCCSRSPGRYILLPDTPIPSWGEYSARYLLPARWLVAAGHFLSRPTWMEGSVPLVSFCPFTARLCCRCRVVISRIGHYAKIAVHSVSQPRARCPPGAERGHGAWPAPAPPRSAHGLAVFACGEVWRGWRAARKNGQASRVTGRWCGRDLTGRSVILVRH